MDPKYVVLYAIKAITVIAIVMVISISLHGCGSCSRNVAMITGVSRECVDGVEYLQFPSGVSVAYNLDGSIKQCLKKINIYLDDERESPKCFIRTFTVDETINLLKKHNGNIGILSLDNDLGEGLEEGRKVIDWIDEQVNLNPEYILPDEIEVHSANGPAAIYMKKVIKRLYF